MHRSHRQIRGRFLLWVVAILFASAVPAAAAITGITPTGEVFSLAARAGEVSTADGNNVLVWGYADTVAGTLPQYPGPTLIVNQGAEITVSLFNELSEPVSIVFPGQSGVAAVGGQAGLLAREAPPGGSVQYTFTATHPGTYMYHSGTHPELQVEMGLFGALIVRPTGFDAMSTKQAYGDPASAYDHEYLYVLSEMDDRVHDLVAFGRGDEFDFTTHRQVYWFINGRVGPDTLLADNTAYLPHQPYGSFTRTRPGDRILVRLVGANRDLHPFHTHGANVLIIAQDGRVLSSTPAAANPAPDLAYSDFTQTAVPGKTYDGIFTWTGFELGWDIFGPIVATCTDSDNDGFDDTSGALCHDALCQDLVNNRTGVAGADGFDDATWEYCADHGKPIPVALPNLKDLAFGGFWSGSPFLGAMGALPPGEGGLNLNGGIMFMWHSHNELELTNNDIFPGGMFTMLVVEPPGVAIP